MNVYVGVDCGATHLRVGLVDEQGNLLAHSKTPSPLKSQPEQFAAQVKEEVTKLLAQNPDWEAIALGVGTPGPLDLEKGLLLPSSNLGNTQSIDLVDQFDKEFNIPIYFDRDTNLALLGESWLGAAVGKKDVVMLTLGSGVGGALMIEGQIERGASGKAGEIGHTILSLVVLPKRNGWRGGDPPAGRAGISGVDRSEQGERGRTRDTEATGPVTSKIPRCGLGHENCLEALISFARNPEELATYLGYGLANIVDIFNPQMIVIGGGKISFDLPSDKQEEFLSQATTVMKKEGTKGAVDEVEVVYAKLGDESGVYGGAKLAHDSNTHKN